MACREGKCADVSACGRIPSTSARDCARPLSSPRCVIGVSHAAAPLAPLAPSAWIDLTQKHNVLSKNSFKMSRKGWSQLHTAMSKPFHAWRRRSASASARQLLLVTFLALLPALVLAISASAAFDTASNQEPPRKLELRTAKQWLSAPIWSVSESRMSASRANPQC